MATVEVLAYWSTIARFGCVACERETLQVCGRPAEIAHCHGGSITERLQSPKAKGKKLPYMDWLVLPLCPEHHRLGSGALDEGVARWEAIYGPQVDYVNALIERTRINVWKKAEGKGLGRHPWRISAS